MEFLGDSIMQLVATEYLFIHFPDHHDGHLTVSLSSVTPSHNCVGIESKKWEAQIHACLACDLLFILGGIKDRQWNQLQILCRVSYVCVYVCVRAHTYTHRVRRT